MAFKGNTEKVEVKKDLLMYTGIISSKVLLINPTAEELEKINIKYEREIEYTSKSSEGEDRVRLDFWLHCFNPTIKADTRTKLSFFITNRPKTDKDKSKVCYINDFGRLSWTTDGTTFDTWFDPKGARPCLDGEDLLIRFIRDWINPEDDDPIHFESIEALFQGNFKELADLLAAYKDNPPMKLMLIVTKSKDNKYYQSVYNKYSARWNNTSILPWKKHIDADKRNIPTTLQNGWSYDLRIFVPGNEVAAEANNPPDEEIAVKF